MPLGENAIARTAQGKKRTGIIPVHHTFMGSDPVFGLRPQFQGDIVVVLIRSGTEVPVFTCNQDREENIRENIRHPRHPTYRGSIGRQGGEQREGKIDAHSDEHQSARPTAFDPTYTCIYVYVHLLIASRPEHLTHLLQATQKSRGSDSLHSKGTSVRGYGVRPDGRL